MTWRPLLLMSFGLFSPTARAGERVDVALGWTTLTAQSPHDRGWRRSDVALNAGATVWLGEREGLGRLGVGLEVLGGGEILGGVSLLDVAALATVERAPWHHLRASASAGLGGARFEHDDFCFSWSGTSDESCVDVQVSGPTAQAALGLGASGPVGRRGLTMGMSARGWGAMLLSADPLGSAGLNLDLTVGF